MKLFSIKAITKGISEVLNRFPTVFFITIAAVVIAFQFIYFNTHSEYLTKDYEAREHHLSNYALALVLCNIALTLTLAVDLFAERNHWTSINKWISRIAVILIAVLLFFILDPFLYQTDVFRIILMIVGFHFFVAVSPFLIKGNVNGFWQFNKTLFLRILTSGLYSVVLFIGLALALVTIDKLFNVEVKEEYYGYLASLIFIGFNTIFFLSAIPKDWFALQQDTSYPVGLKIFTQYVLMPLIVIYLLILLGYEAKIAIEGKLPEGYVSMMIMAYGVCGILSILLVYPIQHLPENRWVRIFSKIFFYAMIPILVLLWLAIFRRIGDYGWTEPRYMLLLLAIWLTVVTFYFIISRKENIKLLPLSLSILALIVVFGPVSASFISKNSQTERLKRLLSNKEDKSYGDVKSVISYLYEHYGTQPFHSLLTQDPKQLELALKHNKTSNYGDVDTLVKMLNVDITKMNETSNLNRYQSSFIFNDKVDISGYNYFQPLIINIPESNKQYFVYNFEIDEKQNLVLYRNQSPTDTIILLNKLEMFKQKYKPNNEYSEYYINEEDATFYNKDKSIKVVLNRIYLYQNPDQQPSLNVEGFIFWN